MQCSILTKELHEILGSIQELASGDLVVWAEIDVVVGEF